MHTTFIQTSGSTLPNRSFAEKFDSSQMFAKIPSIEQKSTVVRQNKSQDLKFIFANCLSSKKSNFYQSASEHKGKFISIDFHITSYFLVSKVA